MSDNNQIPKFEAELSKKLGKVLEEKRSLLSIDDPLLDELFNQKKELYNIYENELRESKKQSWDVISENIEKENNSTLVPKSAAGQRPIFGVNTSMALKIAASILVAAVLSLSYLLLDSNQGQMVQEAGSSLTKITLNDESSVELRPNSRLLRIEETSTAVRYKLEGEAFFDITKDENRQFFIHAGSGIIEVTGTSFNIREWSDETVVYLRDGALSISAADNSSRVQVYPGETAAINAGFEISKTTDIIGQIYTSWRKNKIVLQNRTVESVIKELEYHYKIEIQIPTHLKSEILGGSLTLESRDQSLENLGIVLGGDFSSISPDSYEFVD